MIIGSGLIAKAFHRYERLLDGTCIYAAGVSNSSCMDEQEFARDRMRLERYLAITDPLTRLVYISTCSVDDPGSKSSKYVAHKLDLEQLVQSRNGLSLVVRLPQVAGHTPNPHTILNYLYARISRSEKFDLWRRSSRNVIDVEDIPKILTDLLATEEVSAGLINVANSRSFLMPEIVAAFERITKRQAIYNLLEKGSQYLIDSTPIHASVKRCRIEFDDGYLLRTLMKYYH